MSERPNDLVEFKIIVQQAGYTRAITVQRFTSNGDGTERAYTVGRVTRDERTAENGDLGQWEADNVKAIREAMTTAARSVLSAARGEAKT